VTIRAQEFVRCGPCRHHRDHSREQIYARVGWRATERRVVFRRANPSFARSGGSLTPAFGDVEVLQMQAAHIVASTVAGTMIRPA
jgi:hypothetical protein